MTNTRTADDDGLRRLFGSRRYIRPNAMHIAGEFRRRHVAYGKVNAARRHDMNATFARTNARAGEIELAVVCAHGRLCIDIQDGRSDSTVHSPETDVVPDDRYGVELHGRVVRDELLDLRIFETHRAAFQHDLRKRP